MTATLTACEHGSSVAKTFVKTCHFKDKSEFFELYNEFANEVPFLLWYVEAQSDDPNTETLVNSWLE